MSDKHLTEPAWKPLVAKHKLKDTKVTKALVELAKCDAADADARLKALAVVEKEAEALKKDQKANKDVTDYLGEILKEVIKSRTATEALKKEGKKEAAIAKEKEKEKEKEEEEAEGEAEDDGAGADLKGALNSAMRKVKARQAGDPPVEAMVCQLGKLFGVLLGKKVGAGHAKVLKTVLKGTGHKFAKGTCEWGKGDIYTFALESSLSGAAAGLKVFFKEQSGNSYKIRVGAGGVMEEDLTEEKPTEGDPAAAFKKRFETVVPKIKAAVAGGNPKGQEMTTKAQAAAAAAKIKDYDAANKALDAVDELLGVAKPKTAETKPTVPTGAPTLSTYVKAKRDWKAAKTAAEKNIAALKSAILTQCDPELEAPVKARINVWDGILTIMDDSIIPVIDEAIKEQDEDRQVERNKSLAASVTKMLTALRAHPLAPVADANPFGKFAIRGPLESVLTGLSAAFSH